ncbi:zinc ABC transporter substrate-binding protein [Chitinophagales bacterium]|nr:zinc ABC transporter substrate-binding protein [Chitinophagales bacterium]
MKTRILPAFLIMALMIIMSCQTEKKENTANTKTGGKKQIVATTGMIADMLKHVGGDYIEVESLMGPGVDPHLYKATQGDLRKLRAADAIFYNGLKLEGKMEEIFEKMAAKKMVEAISKNIPEESLIKIQMEHSDLTQVDPHIWFDIVTWASCLSTVEHALAELIPEGKKEFQKNRSAYANELMDLHKKVELGLARIPQESRKLVTSHDAFSYFARAYNIKVSALQGMSTVTEFGLRDIANLVNEIVDEQVPAIFVESSIDPKNMNAVIEGCRQKGFEVRLGGPLFSDAMGAEGTPEGEYVGMIEHNLRTIVKGLTGS